MSEAPFSLWVYLSQSPLLWLTVTLLTYAATDAVAGVFSGIAMSLNALVTSFLVPLAVTFLIR